MSSSTDAESSAMAIKQIQDDNASASASASRISVHLPTNFLILPPVAGLIGLGIGMSRGGSRARLRFLAENAHRPPTTYRGWYFYTKTRNYRILYGALRTGGKYAAALSGATLAYVVLDESVGVAREALLGTRGVGQWRETESQEGMPRRVGWREGGVWWGDGIIAGGLLGSAVGVIFRLPRPLFARSAIIGMMMGGTTSSLQAVQAKVGEMRESATPSAQQPTAELANVELPIPPTPTTPSSSPDTASRAIESELPQLSAETTQSGGWSRLWSWIPGVGR